KIAGCWIGTDKTGAAKAGNGSNGIIVQAPNNTIGGTSSADRNVISGNGTAGVLYYTAAASHNTILGNYVGTDATGTRDLGNTGAGICATDGAHNNTIGGSSSSFKNVVAGNDLCGVGVYNGSNSNQIKFNDVGIAANGNALPNSKQGVLVVSS